MRRHLLAERCFNCVTYSIKIYVINFHYLRMNENSLSIPRIFSRFYDTLFCYTFRSNLNNHIIHEKYCEIMLDFPHILRIMRKCSNSWIYLSRWKEIECIRITFKIFVSIMVSRHHDGILYEAFNKKFEIIAFKSGHALNGLWKWPDKAREISKLFVKI